MSHEGKNKKTEQTNSAENKEGKEFSISEIDDVLKQKTDIFDSLDKYTKDEIFKNIGFRGVVEIKDKAEDNYDSYAYEKAGLWKKFDNFITFGLSKEFLGLVRAKDGELLDKTAIRDGMEGRVWNFVDREGDAYKHEEQKISKQFNITEEDSAKRIITKTYEFVDGKIEKLIKSSRTEEGMIKTAGELREEQISLCEKKDGTDLVSFKESMEKNAESRKNISKMMGVMSEEEKEKIIAKLDEEESQTKEKIKDKEEKISEELNIFREPFEERLKETIEMENSLKKGHDFIKMEESKLKNQIKEYDDYIKEAQKLNLLGDVGGDIVKILEEKKAIADASAKEFAEQKVLVASKLEVLKNNRKEIQTTLNRINNVGKTKQEIAEKKKNEKKDETEIEMNEEKTQPKTADDRKTEDDWAKDWSFKGKNKEGMDKQWDKDRYESWGLKGVNYTLGESDQQASKGEAEEEVETKRGKKVSAKKKPKKAKDADNTKDIKAQEEGQIDDEAKSVVVETERVAERKFTDDEIEKLVTEELKTLGFVNNKNIAETSKSGLTKLLIEAVKNEILKSTEQVTEDYIKNEVDDWYKRFTRNKDKENKKSVEKVFNHKEIEEIAMKELKDLGIISIKDRTMREQIIGNVIRAVEATIAIAKSKKPLEEEDIKKEVGKWYRKYSKNHFKKGKQTKT